MLFLHNLAQSLIQRHISRERKDIWPRYHDFSYRDVVQFEGVMDHLLLSRRNLAKLAAGSDNEFQFIRRVNGAMPQLAGAKKAQHGPGRTAHEEKDGPSQSEENIHGRCHCQSDLLSS